MTYVDRARHWGWMMRGHLVKNCHLVADTLDELHAMAKAIGMKPEWFQDKKIPHYDLTEKRRAAAVKLGARELTTHEFYDLIIRRRKPCETTSEPSSIPTKS